MKNLVYSGLILLSLASCQSKRVELVLPEKSEIWGLASVVNLPADTGSIVLGDFFDNPSLIDSVSAVKGIQFQLSNNKEILKVSVEQGSVKPLSIISIWIKGVKYAIAAKKSAKVLYEYQFDSKGKDYQTVQLAGDINGWQPIKTPLKNENGIWKITLTLNPGKYSYQVVTDGKWMLDPALKDSVSNGIGGFNSVLNVKAGDDAKKPILYTAKFDDGYVDIGQINPVDDWAVLWENYQIPFENIAWKDSILRIHLPKAAQKFDFSTLRVFASNGEGLGNYLTIPLKKGKVVTDVSDLPKDDYHSSIMYFMMVDRFVDGDSTNNKPVIDSEVLPKANYYGGDIRGIIQKIQDGYFKSLNVNTIWISPINQNPEGAYREFPKPNRKFSGYHGYWPISSSKVDHRMGTDDELKELVDVAHKNGIKILLDFVSNHVHIEHPVYKQHPEWFNSIDLPDGRKNIRIWDEQRLSTWFDTFMPDINYEKPEAVNAFSDSAVFWLKKFGIDGFRHDATKHVSEVFWRALTKKVKNEVAKSRNERVYQIGETFGTRELIGSYINSGEMDAQFDFNLYFDAVNILATENQSFSDLASSLQESFNYYGANNLMGNITGNHDLVRFITKASDGLKPGEDEKEAGWQREIKIENPVGYDRLKLLQAFLFTIPGIPIVYYGDEQGIPGANDPDNRRMMYFTGLNEKEQSVLANCRKLTQLRASKMALVYGNTQLIYADKKVMVYARSYFNQTILIALNRTAQAIEVDVDVPRNLQNLAFKSLVDDTKIETKKTVKIPVQPYQYQLFEIQ